MLSDLRTIRALPTPRDAIVVVGSGAAGIALSERLSSAGKTVVLLESGTDVKVNRDERARADELNEGIALGLPYTGLTQGRSRQLGGAAQLWHGQCMRLYDLDLRERPWIARSGWPFELDELDEHYAAAERWLGVTGIGYGPERWLEHADLPPLDWDSRHLLHDFTEYTARPMLGREHRGALSQNPLVHTVLNATVSRIITDRDRVTGVGVVGPDGRRLEISAHQVVLAAGAVENARILQLSDPDGIGLGTGRAHTGRYLQDHPIIRTAQVIPSDYRVLQDRYVALHKGSRRLFPKVRLAPQAQEDYQLVDATAVFVHDHEQPALAAARRLLLAARSHQAPELLWQDVRAASGAPAPVLKAAYRRFVQGRSTAAEPSAVWLQIWLEQVPDPESRVSLGSATDRFGLRQAEVRWRASDQELETSRRMTRFIAEDLARLGIAEVRELAPMHDDDAWRAQVTDAFHPSGTTRMSDSPQTGVVDPDLEVHGLRGLFAVGGSVFPIAGYANPTLTIVALALRLADRLVATAGSAPTRVG